MIYWLVIYRPTFNPVPYLNPSLPTVYSLSIYRLIVHWLIVY